MPKKFSKYGSNQKSRNKENGTADQNFDCDPKACSDETTQECKKECANYVKPTRHKEKTQLLKPNVLNIIVAPSQERIERIERRHHSKKILRERENDINYFTNFGNGHGNGYENPCTNGQQNNQTATNIFGMNQLPSSPNQCSGCTNTSRQTRNSDNCEKGSKFKISNDTYYVCLSYEPLCEIRVVNPKKSVPVHVLTDRLVQNKMSDDGFINNQYDGSVILNPGAFVSFIPVYDDYGKCSYWGIYGTGFENCDFR